MNLFYELQYTLRVIRRKIGFSSLCVLVIALGYGVAIPLYSIVQNLGYASLPFPDGERIVVIKQTDSRTGSEQSAFSFDEYLFNTIRDASASFDAIAALQEDQITLSGEGLADTYFAARISAAGLNLAATNPILGRSLNQADQLLGAEPVVLLGHSVWENYFARSDDVLGTTTRIDGVAHTIVGVMPQDYKFPQSYELWLPLADAPAAVAGDTRGLMLIGKLSENHSRAQASADVGNIMLAAAVEYPEHYENRSAKVSPLIHASVRNAVTLHNMIVGLAFGIFLLVCVKVGNLLLIRANERIAELSIRSAIGATRINLLSHALFESLIICLLGTLFGVLLAAFGVRFFGLVLLNEFDGGRSVPFWMDFGFQANYLAVVLILMFLLWGLSGAVAAWRASRSDLNLSISGVSKGAKAKVSAKFTRSLVLIQTILSFGLLLFAGAFLIVLPQRYQTTNIELEDEFVKAAVSSVADSDVEKRSNEIFREDLARRLQESIPDIELVTYASSLPSEFGRFVRVSEDVNSVTDNERLGRHYVSGIFRNYFDALKIPLLAGRFFDATDNFDSESVVIVDTSFHGTIAAVESVVGELIQIESSDGSTSERARIIGVVPYIGPAVTESGAEPAMLYRPISQSSTGRYNLLARISGAVSEDLGGMQERVQRIANSINPDVPINRFSLLREEMNQANPEIKLIGGIFGGAALAALLLTSVGVYGLISRTVFVRAGEIGIRRAVGSSNWSVIKIFLNQGLLFIVAGAVFGGGGAVLILNAIESNLQNFNLMSSLSLVFLSVMVLVGGLICYSSYVPVRKLVGLEPGEALHYE